MAETPNSGLPSLGQIAVPDAFKDDLILLGKYQ
jgi:hypothetical protein